MVRRTVGGVLLSCIAAVAALLWTISPVEAQPKGPIPKAGRPNLRPVYQTVEGSITLVTPLTITRANGTTVVLDASTAVITLNGVTGTGTTVPPFTSLVSGMRAEAAYKVTTAGNIASQIRAYDMSRVEGSITLLAPLTITRANGTAVVLDASKAVITLDGGASTVVSLAIGMRVEASYTVATAGTIRAYDMLRVEGSITLLAPLTITRANGTTVVLDASTAVITLNGVTGTGTTVPPFTSLVSGMRAEAAYKVTTAGNIASQIRAYDMSRVEGSITLLAPLTITRANGTAVVLDASKAVITLDGGASTVVSLAIGMRVEASYTVATAGTIRAYDMLRVEGSITLLAPLTITRANGTTVVLDASTAVITLNGVTGTGTTVPPFTSLVSGMRAEAAYKVTTAGNIASQIRAYDMSRVEGSITLLAPLTITRANGTTVVLDASKAVITLDGGASTVGSLAIGMRVEASYTGATAGVLRARTARTP